MIPLVFATKFQEAQRLTETVREADRLIDEAITLYDGDRCTDHVALMDALRRLEVIAHRYAKDIRMTTPTTGISVAAIRIQLDRMRSGMDDVIMRLHVLTLASERDPTSVDLEREATRILSAEMTGIAIYLNDSLGSSAKIVRGTNG